MFSECFMVFLTLFHIYVQRTGFWAEIFKNFSKRLKTCLVGVFWVFHGIFSIIRHLSREPDFSAKNLIFKNFLKCLKACLVGVVWVLQSLFLTLFDIWAANRTFEPRTRFSKRLLKSLKTCLVGVFWVFQGIFSIVRHLSREPDVWAEKQIFKN